MCNNCNYTIHGAHHHFGWDRSIPPVEKVAPGSTIRFECMDSGSGHFNANSTAADVATLDFSKVNPVTGPVYIDGAEPGTRSRSPSTSSSLPVSAGRGSFRVSDFWRISSPVRP